MERFPAGQEVRMLEPLRIFRHGGTGAREEGAAAASHRVRAVSVGPEEEDSEGG